MNLTLQEIFIFNNYKIRKKKIPPLIVLATESWILVMATISDEKLKISNDKAAIAKTFEILKFSKICY